MPDEALMIKAPLWWGSYPDRETWAKIGAAHGHRYEVWDKVTLGGHLYMWNGSEWVTSEASHVDEKR